MPMFIIILGIILWAALVFWPASVASRKGYSFLGFFLISIFFFWITLFVVYLMPDRTKITPTAAPV